MNFRMYFGMALPMCFICSLVLFVLAILIDIIIFTFNKRKMYILCIRRKIIKVHTFKEVLKIRLRNALYNFGILVLSMSFAYLLVVLLT